MTQCNTVVNANSGTTQQNTRWQRNENSGTPNTKQGHNQYKTTVQPNTKQRPPQYKMAKERADEYIRGCLAELRVGKICAVICESLHRTQTVQLVRIVGLLEPLGGILGQQFGDELHVRHHCLGGRELLGRGQHLEIQQHLHVRVKTGAHQVENSLHFVLEHRGVVVAEG